MTRDNQPTPAEAEPFAGYSEVVQTYRQLREYYIALAEQLAIRLQGHCRRLNIHAIVQGRAKSVASFAEKVIRKGYLQPFVDTMDLCGVRVIVSTLNDVERLGKAIVSDPGLHLLKEESGDKRQGLMESGKFGYLSVHYVVALDLGEFPLPELRARLGSEVRAELQLRTVLQHAWADISHDLAYKNHLNLPPELRREFDTLAAILEDADRQFDRVRLEVERYAADYLAYRDRAALDAELRRQETLLRVDPKDQQAAHRLAQMAMCLDDWARAVAALAPFASTDCGALRRDIGISLCKLYRREPEGAAFAGGQGHLEWATQLEQEDVDAWASLGGTWRTREEAAGDDPEKSLVYRQKACDCYRRAWELRPSHAYSLGNYLEYLIADHPDLDILSFFRPSLEMARDHCRWQARVGLNLPWALFDLGKFELMLRRHPEEALCWYARGVFRSTGPDKIDSARRSFAKLSAVGATMYGFDWCERLLRLALWAVGERGERPAGDGREPEIRAPVVIVVGDSERPIPESTRRQLRGAFRDFHGTLIAGGTTAGASVVVGELQVDNPGLLTIGYLPAQLPVGVEIDERYRTRRRSDGAAFSPWETLLYWTDLLVRGIHPADVRLLCLGGREIARCECAVALALGARIGVLADDEASSAVAEVFSSFWDKQPTVRIRLHDDASEVRRFLFFTAESAENAEKER
jgi:ppGpp synthetase/RelA/SpoT-type nucleotidyltranferase